MTGTSTRQLYTRFGFGLFLMLVVCSVGWAQSPSISSMTPTSGPVGLPVQISGSNFGSSPGTSTVTLGGVTAQVTSWSATSIVARVPTGASTGVFRVTVSGQYADS